MARRISLATLHLLGMAATLGATPPARERTQTELDKATRDEDDRREREQRRADKLARRAARAQAMGTVINPSNLQPAKLSPRQAKKQRKLARRAMKGDTP